jgi:hypothetical protein
MDRIGSVADYSSGLAHGFVARAAFTATLTIAMILVAVTMDPFQRVGNSRSITSMPTRRETGKVTLGMLGMMGAVSAAPVLRAAATLVAAAMLVAAVTARVPSNQK